MPRNPPPPGIIALLHGPDQTGLVARTGAWIWEHGGNILHASQHHDHEVNVFFQRLEWTAAPGTDPREAGNAFRDFAANTLGMTVHMALTTDRPPVAVFVSKISHCFHDILLRAESGELQGRIACIISNHPDLESASGRYGVPFYYVPVSRESREEAETRQLKILREHDIHLVLMARYMQILSESFFTRFSGKVINIHHSFLPAFAGARPYHQAYSRGVKVIGATAHYATPELDQGPIICQEIAPVNHRYGVADLMQKGRDLERIAFAEATRLHLENRILVYDNKTVVFD